MSEVEAHYARVLAPVYVWMAGGLEASVTLGAEEVEAIGASSGQGRVAVDLGAGFGMHALPLAAMGWRVIAIDSSPLLLDELRRQAEGLDVRCIDGDLLDFASHVDEPPSLILCMGDTLTHLPDEAAVSRLFADVARALEPGGRFVASFRDYGTPPAGDGRFILVRADEHRVHTCFLETASATHMRVHDLLHERDAEGRWRMTVGSYPKLRLAPARAAALAGEAGLEASIAPAPRGFWRLLARRPAQPKRTP